MTIRKTLSPNNLPTRSPISFALILYLLFDKWNVASWVYGAVGVFLALWFIVFVYNFFNDFSIDIFKNWDEGSFGRETRKSKFQQKLEELKTKN